MRTQRYKFILIALTFLIALGLSGCFKGEISVDVKENGKGMIGVAFGMTQEAKALLSMQIDSSTSQPTNPLEQIQKELTEKAGLPGDVKVSNWVDGDYEWFKVEKGFNNLDEINQLAADNEIFKSFSLTRKAGLLQNEFILVGELDSLSQESSSGGIQIDPSMFIQMQFVLRLPGKILETNGLVDINDPNKMAWQMHGNHTVPMMARSVAWNWVNITILVAIGGLVVLAGLSAVGLVLFKSPKPNVQPVPQKAVSTEKPILENSDQLVDLGIDDLLRQVNERALNNLGGFYHKQGVIVLTWTDKNERQRFIEVKDLRQGQISINGQIYPATKESAKQGILAVLKS